MLLLAFACDLKSQRAPTKRIKKTAQRRCAANGLFRSHSQSVSGKTLKNEGNGCAHDDESKLASREDRGGGTVDVLEIGGRRESDEEVALQSSGQVRMTFRASIGIINLT